MPRCFWTTSQIFVLTTPTNTSNQTWLGSQRVGVKGIKGKTCGFRTLPGSQPLFSNAQAEDFPRKLTTDWVCGGSWRERKFRIHYILSCQDASAPGRLHLKGGSPPTLPGSLPQLLSWDHPTRVGVESWDQCACCHQVVWREVATDEFRWPRWPGSVQGRVFYPPLSLLTWSSDRLASLCPQHGQCRRPSVRESRGVPRFRPCPHIKEAHRRRSRYNAEGLRWGR